MKRDESAYLRHILDASLFGTPLFTMEKVLEH
jgi:hypothetical protein